MPWANLEPPLWGFYPPVPRSLRSRSTGGYSRCAPLGAPEAWQRRSGAVASQWDAVACNRGLELRPSRGTAGGAAAAQRRRSGQARSPQLAATPSAHRPLAPHSVHFARCVRSACCVRAVTASTAPTPPATSARLLHPLRPPAYSTHRVRPLTPPAASARPPRRAAQSVLM
ncbi:MAG: hypothetical protein LBS59_07220 [Puniceicoccales bacterium]|nr:hypothetical protein [Puniceicoccales bacterium]